DAARELAREDPFQDGIVARAYHQFHAVKAKLPRHSKVAPFTVGIVGQPEGRVRDARLVGQLERCAIAVGADDHDARRVERILHRLDQGLQVAAPAGHQDANPEPSHSRVWTRRCADATVSRSRRTGSRYEGWGARSASSTV